MNLLKHQIEFFNYWNDVLPNGILNWDRASGKTFISNYISINYVINNPNESVFLYYYGSLLPFVRDDLIDIFKELNKEHLIKQENAKLIRLTNNSEIKMFSLTQKRLAGSYPSLICIDEFGYMPDDIFEEFIFYKVAFPNVKTILNSSMICKNKIQKLIDNVGYDKYFIHEKIN